MRLLLLALSIIFTTTISAQHLTEKFTALDIGFGPRNLTTVPGEYNVSFATNTNSYSFDRKLEEKHNAFGINLGLSLGNYSGLNHQIYFDLAFGKQGSGKFGYGIGWGFALEVDKFDILLRPALGIANGGTNITFGSFSVDTISQFIVDREFNDTNVTVNLEQSTTYLVPEFKATFLVAQKYGFFASIAYDLALNNKTQKFKFGKNSDLLDITDPYIEYIRTDLETPIPVIDNIFSPGGLRFTFGISTFNNKDLYD